MIAKQLQELEIIPIRWEEYGSDDEESDEASGNQRVVDKTNDHRSSSRTSKEESDLVDESSGDMGIKCSGRSKALEREESSDEGKCTRELDLKLSAKKEVQSSSTSETVYIENLPLNGEDVSQPISNDHSTDKPNEFADEHNLEGEQSPNNANEKPTWAIAESEPVVNKSNKVQLIPTDGVAGELNRAPDQLKVDLISVKCKSFEPTSLPPSDDQRREHINPSNSTDDKSNTSVRTVNELHENGEASFQRSESAAFIERQTESEMDRLVSRDLATGSRGDAGVDTEFETVDRPTVFDRTRWQVF